MSQPREPVAANRQECDDPKCACHQLAWMGEMERVEQEVFPDARPRGEVTVPNVTTVRDSGVSPCFVNCDQPACQKLGCVRVYNAQNGGGSGRVNATRTKKFDVGEGNAQDVCPRCGIWRVNAGYTKDSCGPHFRKPGCLVKVEAKS